MTQILRSPLAVRKTSSKRLLPAALLLAGACAAAATYTAFTPIRAAADEPATKDQKFDHTVFFTLSDASPENQKKLIEGCKKYLTGHDGELSFSVGRRSDLAEQFNDRDFDLVLHMVFKNKAAFDAYIPSDRHQAFIKEFKPAFKKIRVFDSYLDGE